jgi:hypothetical protein
MSDDEQRLHRAAVTKAGHQAPEPEVPDEAEQQAAIRHDEHVLRVDAQVRDAIARGEFDNLPGAGKPLKLPDRHDPDWWVKQLIEREKITGVLPPALGLRKEDAELDAALDREPTEEGVRRVVDDFNRRVVEARRQLQGGPPVVTPTRDPDAEVAAWQARRAERRARARAVEPEPEHRSRRWWRRAR